jgi:hypothetical protein
VTTLPPASGQPDFPTKPIKVIVPYPAGGLSDFQVRAVAEPLGKLLGQPIIVDNRPGASAGIGTQAAAASPGLRFVDPARPSLARRLPPSWWLGKLMQLALNHPPIALFRPFVMAFMIASPGLAIAQQPGGRAWLVFDSRVARMFSEPPHYISTAPGVAFAYLPDYRRHRKDLCHCADTIGALAASLGMPARGAIRCAATAAAGRVSAQVFWRSFQSARYLTSRRCRNLVTSSTAASASRARRCLSSRRREGRV